MWSNFNDLIEVKPYHDFNLVKSKLLLLSFLNKANFKIIF